jgi:hypothetical protein
MDRDARRLDTARILGHRWTLPELARDHGVPASEYAGFVARVRAAADRGEVEFCCIESHGWTVPAVRIGRETP